MRKRLNQLNFEFKADHAIDFPAEFFHHGVVGSGDLPSCSPFRVSLAATAASRFGVAGARQEAAAGFPHVFHIGLPALLKCLSRGVEFRSAVLQSFFSLMAVLPDTNLLFRGGAQGLLRARAATQSFLDEGGVYRENWREHALAIHHDMIARNLSPGGSADLLAATLFVRRLQGSLKRPQ